VVQSSCGLHSYRVELKTPRQQPSTFTFLAPTSATSPSSSSNSSTSSSPTEAEEEEDNDDASDPVFCSSPREIAHTPESRSMSPSQSGEAAAPSLVDRLSELEQMMDGSSRRGSCH